MKELTREENKVNEIGEKNTTKRDYKKKCVMIEVKNYVRGFNRDTVGYTVIKKGERNYKWE